MIKHDKCMAWEEEVNKLRKRVSELEELTVTLQKSLNKYEIYNNLDSDLDMDFQSWLDEE